MSHVDFRSAQSMAILKSMCDIIQPCITPVFIGNQLELPFSALTQKAESAQKALTMLIYWAGNPLISRIFHSDGPFALLCITYIVINCFILTLLCVDL